MINTAGIDRLHQSALELKVMAVWISGTWRAFFVSRWRPEKLLKRRSQGSLRQGIFVKSGYKNQSTTNNDFFTNLQRGADPSLMKMIVLRFPRAIEETIMGSAIPLGDFKDVMLDIDSELQYWNEHYTRSAFHRKPCSFDRYLPTIKFGYDMYLLNRGDGLDELLPLMRARYEATMEACRRLDWPLAEAVIRETWKRMRPEINHRKEARQVRLAPQPSDLSRPLYRAT
jgi:hypothetical protein